MDSTHWQKCKRINTGRQRTCRIHCKRSCWIQCKWLTVAISERKMYLSGQVPRMHSFLLIHNTIIKFNNCNTRHVNRPRRLFHSFCYTNYPAYIEPLCVYEPGFNMAKYSTFLLSNSYAINFLYLSCSDKSNDICDPICKNLEQSCKPIFSI